MRRGLALLLGAALVACGDDGDGVYGGEAPAPQPAARAAAPASAPDVTVDASLPAGAYDCFDARGEHRGRLRLIEGGVYRFEAGPAAPIGGYRLEPDGRTVRFEGGALEADAWRGEVARREDGEPTIALVREGGADGGARLDCGFGGSADDPAGLAPAPPSS